MEYEKLWFSLMEHITTEIRDIQKVDRFSLSLTTLYAVDARLDTLRQIEKYMADQMDRQRSSGVDK